MDQSLRCCRPQYQPQALLATRSGLGALLAWSWCRHRDRRSAPLESSPIRPNAFPVQDQRWPEGKFR